MVVVSETRIIAPLIPRKESPPSIATIVSPERSPSGRMSQALPVEATARYTEVCHMKPVFHCETQQRSSIHTEIQAHKESALITQNEISIVYTFAALKGPSSE